MDKFIEYAPIIIVILGFFSAYKIFVTPVQMEKELSEFEHRLEKKFVLKETHNLAIAEMKSDIEEIKDKINRIYDKLMQV
jgi:septation ring formation regulator EzrA